MKKDKPPPELFKRLEQKLSKDAIYKRIERKIGKYDHTITPRIASFLVAKDLNISPTRFLDKEDREELKKALTFSRPAKSTSIRIVERKVTESLEPLKGISPIEPILSSKLLNEAKEMAKNAYPILYIFENSVRNIIIMLMENKYGKDWWDLRVKQLHPNMNSRVESRMTEEKENRWCSSKRGSDKIYYTDLDELRIIIEDNWNIFKKIHNRRTWVIEHIMQLRYSRNIIAHNNLLKERDIESIQTKIREWFNQIKGLINKGRQ